MKLPFWLDRLFRYVVFGNIWVSFAAVCMFWATEKLFQIQEKPTTGIFIFGGTLFIYNFHRLFRMKAIYAKHSSDRHNWIIKNRNHVIALTLLGFILALVGGFAFLNKEIIGILLPFVLISLFYVIPIYKKEGVWIRLRDLSYVKIFLVAGVWSFVTVCLPFVILPDFHFQSLLAPNIILTATQRFLFFFAITLPFDIRDLEYDRKNSVRTFAALLGVEGIKNFSRVLLVLVSLIALYCYKQGYYLPGHTLAMIISCASTNWLISKANENSNEFYYSGWLDGTLMDQYFWMIFLASMF
jgi:4-hydroxybenzoate polyprenyltransferase